MVTFRCILATIVLLCSTVLVSAFPAELGGNDLSYYQQLERLPITRIPATRSAHIGAIIFRISMKYGLDPFTMLAFASIESDFFPESNMHARTQYKGVYQIGTDEWRTWGCGKWCSTYQAEDNIDAAGAMLARHADWFRYWFGRDPTAGELYMIHQQGRGFFTHHTLTNVKGNPYPGMGPAKDETWESFGAGWEKEVNRRYERFRSYAAIIVGDVP